MCDLPNVPLRGTCEGLSARYLCLAGWQVPETAKAWHGLNPILFKDTPKMIWGRAGTAQRFPGTNTLELAVRAFATFVVVARVDMPCILANVMPESTKLHRNPLRPPRQKPFPREPTDDCFCCVLRVSCWHHPSWYSTWLFPGGPPHGSWQPSRFGRHLIVETRQGLFLLTSLDLPPSPPAPLDYLPATGQSK